jgi:hypothetical protein
MLLLGHAIVINARYEHIRQHEATFNRSTEADKGLWHELKLNPGGIRGDIRARRTVEQRTTLVNHVMQDVSRITSVPESDIWVYLCNLEPTDMIEYGHVLPLPGEEKIWFESLPKTLQTYLEGLDPQAELQAVGSRRVGGVFSWAGIRPASRS